MVTKEDADKAFADYHAACDAADAAEAAAYNASHNAETAWLKYKKLKEEYLNGN